jgi:hypothetical protein
MVDNNVESPKIGFFDKSTNRLCRRMPLSSREYDVKAKGHKLFERNIFYYA